MSPDFQDNDGQCKSKQLPMEASGLRPHRCLILWKIVTKVLVLLQIMMQVVVVIVVMIEVVVIVG